MITISSPEAMFELGKNIGARLRTGDLLVLNGPLGAGKTLLTQGIGDALGIIGITSPTFVISKIHKGRIPLIHVDAYRLIQSENPIFSLDDLDLDSEREDAITVIEWGGELAARLSDERLEIFIDRSKEEREVSAVGHGKRWEDFLL
jgi:tRNA threonylcarbamoyladenosine biosynthesis protein TsaE